MKIENLFKDINLDNMLVKVYIYDKELNSVIDINKYDLVLIKDFDKYCNTHKSQLYDHQYFVKSNI